MAITCSHHPVNYWGKWLTCRSTVWAHEPTFRLNFKSLYSEALDKHAKTSPSTDVRGVPLFPILTETKKEPIHAKQIKNLKEYVYILEIRKQTLSFNCRCESLCQIKSLLNKQTAANLYFLRLISKMREIVVVKFYRLGCKGASLVFLPWPKQANQQKTNK